MLTFNLFSNNTDTQYAAERKYTSSTSGFSYQIGAFGSGTKPNYIFQQNKSKGCFFNITANTNNYKISKVKFIEANKTDTDFKTYLEAFSNSDPITVTVTKAGSGTATISLENPLTISDLSYSPDNYYFAYRVTSSALSFTFKAIEITYLVPDRKIDPELYFDQQEYTFTIGEEFETPVVQNCPEDLPVRYSSSDPDVAYYDGWGTLKLLKAGETVITATTDEDETYKSGTASYRLTVIDPNTAHLEDPAFTWSASTFNAYMGVSNSFPTLQDKPENLTINYASSNPSIAEIDATTGEITLKAPGETIISATSAETEQYKEKTVKYTLTVSKSDPVISFPQTEYTFTKGEDYETPVATCNPEGLEIVYSSSDPSIAYYDEEGKLILVKRGEVDITAKTEGNVDYNAAEAKYHLIVKDSSISDLVYDASCKFWSPTLPTGNTNITEEKEFTCSEHNVTIALNNGRCYNSSFFLAKTTGYVILKNITGIVKSITLYSNKDASSSAVVNIYVNGETQALGSLALTTKDRTTPYTLLVEKYIKNPEEIKIAATKDANVKISKIVVEVEIDKRLSPNLSFPENEYSALINSEFTEPILSYDENYTGTITYTSSNPEVASVDAESGVVTLGQIPGSTTITAKAEATESFAADEASYILTVSEPASLAFIIRVNGETFELEKGADDSYTGEIEIETGSTVTIDTNYGDEAVIEVTDSDENSVEFENGILFDTPGAYSYLITATTQEEEINGSIVVTVKKPATTFSHTIDFSAVPEENSNPISSVVNNPVSVELSAEGKSTPPTIYVTNNVKHLRLYAGNSITISLPEGYKLESVIFNSVSGTESNWTGTPELSHGMFDEDAPLKWVADKDNKQNTLKITNGGTKNHTKIKSIDITYTVDHIAASLDHLVLPSGINIENGSITNKEVVAVRFINLHGHDFHFKHSNVTENVNPEIPTEAPRKINTLDGGVPSDYTKYEESEPILLDRNNNRFEFVTEHKDTGAVSEPVSLGVYVNDVTTGIASIMAEDPEAQIYTLQGIRVTEPQEGQIYIVIRGKKSSKVAY